MQPSEPHRMARRLQRSLSLRLRREPGKSTQFIRNFCRGSLHIPRQRRALQAGSDAEHSSFSAEWALRQRAVVAMSSRARRGTVALSCADSRPPECALAFAARTLRCCSIAPVHRAPALTHGFESIEQAAPRADTHIVSIERWAASGLSGLTGSPDRGHACAGRRGAVDDGHGVEAA